MSSQFTVTPVTADGNGVKMGDLILGLPTKLEREATNLVRGHRGQCVSSRKRSCDDATVAGDIAVKAIERFGDMMPRSPTDILPNLALELARQLPRVKKAGRQVTALVASPKTLAWAATFWLGWAFVEFTSKTPNPTRVVLSASLIASQKPQKTGLNKCPAYIPHCTNCGGNKTPSPDPSTTTGTCYGVIDHEFFAEGCLCIQAKEPSKFEPYPNTQAIKEAIAAVAAIKGWRLPTSTSVAKPLSSSVPPRGVYRLYFEQTLGVKGTDMAPSVWWAMGTDYQPNGTANSEYFTVPLSRRDSREDLLVQWTGDPTSEKTAGLKFVFTDFFWNKYRWPDTSKNATKFQCQQLGTYFESKTTGPTRRLKCMLHAWPSATDDKYRIVMDQRMSRGNFLVNYTLYTYTLNEQISTFNTPLATKLAKGSDEPWNPLEGGVGISIWHTTRKDSIMTFNRNGRFWDSQTASPASSADDGMFYCNQTRAQKWIPWNGGFRRRFSCPFLGNPPPRKKTPAGREP